MGGFYVMQRGWMDHYIFRNEPFTEREAWIWMIEKAGFQPHKLRYKNRIVTVARGQVPTSYRKLSDTWRWGSNRVSGFLATLEREGMISLKTDTGFLVITICNYDEYQRPLRNSETQPETLMETLMETHTETVADTLTDTNRIKENKINEIKEEEREDIHTTFSNLKFEGEFIKFAIDAKLEEEAATKCWQKFKIFYEADPPSYPLRIWKIWVLNERKIPETAKPQLEQNLLEGEELIIHQVGIANWKRKMKIHLSVDETKELERWEKEKGLVFWNNLEEWRSKKI